VWLCLCCALVAQAAPASAPVSTSEEDIGATDAPVVVLNRQITVFRSAFLGIEASERARRTRTVIAEQLGQDGPGNVSVQTVPQGRLVMLDGKMVLILTAEDADKLTQETVDQAAEHAATVLSQVVAETREARDVDALLRSLGLSGLATAILVFLLWLLYRLRRLVFVIAERWTARQARRLHLSGSSILHIDRVIDLLRWALRILYFGLTALLLYEWLSFVLSRFPYTRPWGEQLSRYLLAVIGRIFSAIVHAVPDLLIAAIVFLIAKVLGDMLRAFFDRVENGHISVSWLSPDTLAPTRKLAAVGLWLFALAMAYPYLPGAQTEAFKGLSVLIGLMISLGASSLVGQAASGLILMYTHTLKAGEYVRIGEAEGTVMEVGMFSTRIRTGLGEELTYSNSLILGSVTRNYSRAVKGVGFVVDTTVTIGYDTPWRQVEAMLNEAARRTAGVLTDPVPQVFQTGLSDFYVEYRLVAQAVPSDPRPRAHVLNHLHANIQDVFNEHGVQIMSPHYFEDPAKPKVVPPADWYQAPAQAPGNARES